jgi:hypothetical protein
MAASCRPRPCEAKHTSHSDIRRITYPIGNASRAYVGQHDPSCATCDAPASGSQKVPKRADGLTVKCGKAKGRSNSLAG